PPASVPAPLFDEISQSAQLHPQAPQAPRAQPGFDPLQPEEVAAFKRALAMGVSGRDAMAAGSRAGQHQHPPHNHALLTGFEDTEMANGPEETERLSGTQYGELR
ncbi:MAG: hypothetical protein JWP65_2132, partial [Ramlibacter sp.]|nr:hypothetical protein [Ramlibacter sp.]